MRRTFCTILPLLAALRHGQPPEPAEQLWPRSSDGDI
jgi:hypothetical protein